MIKSPFYHLWLPVIGILSGTLLQAQVKHLYIANDDHTDYMWTADEATYDSAFIKMLDYYLYQIDSTKGNTPDFQARFSCDGNLWLKAYQKHRTPAQFNRLTKAIRFGHISSPINMLVSCYGAQPTEAVIRGMYYAGQLERKYGLRFTLAQSMENNTLPLGLASLWAGSGAKYSWKGIGGYGSQMSYDMRTRRRYQMYRYNGLDSSGLLMKWYAYNEKTTAPLGGYAECRLKIKYKDATKDIGTIVNMLDAFCDTMSAGSNYPYNIAGAFGFGHDDLSTFLSQPFIQVARDATTPLRKVRVSNQEDFFKDFESRYPQVPSQSVSFGNEWDLLSASMNETTAGMRRSTEKLRAAEALASVVSLKNSRFAKDLIAAREDAWESFGVYWEHNWTADGPVTRNARAAWQMKRQQLLSKYVDTLYNRSVNTLGSQLKKSSVPSFYVFNPLSWSRNDVADLHYEGSYPVKVIDKVRQIEVPTQLIVKDGRRMLRLLAEDIPPVGYKVYEIRPGMPTGLPPAATVTGPYFSNRFYRLKLNESGVIEELYDSLARSRQLVKAIDGRYLNDLGGDSLIGKSFIENQGPVSVTVRAESPYPVPHTVRITLFANSSRIEIDDSIQANFADVKTWAFSFDLKKQITRHEELGAVLTARKESRGGHYADENARYDWQTFNHFANMSESGYSITLSNTDCSFFKLGKSTIDSLWEESTQINALAGGNIDKKLEDGGVLGILNQNGQTDFQYKFALVSNQDSFNATRSMKFALEHQNPLVAGVITGKVAILPGNTFSLLSVDHPDVLLWSIKPSEEGMENGLITRFWNLGTAPAEASIKMNKPILRAWKTTHIETNEKLLKTQGGLLKAALKVGGMSTFRVFL
ncbi:MAG: glycoside hydrolase [Chitinophagaceae bacterium]|nr:glycoside hydrolase [Chitinophagaceae bacterium]